MEALSFGTLRNRAKAHSCNRTKGRRHDLPANTTTRLCFSKALVHLVLRKSAAPDVSSVVCPKSGRHSNALDFMLRLGLRLFQLLSKAPVAMLVVGWFV